MLEKKIYTFEDLCTEEKYNYIKELVKILHKYNCSTAILIEDGDVTITYIKPFGKELEDFNKEIARLENKNENSSLTWEDILNFILGKAPGFYPYRDLCRKLFNLENSDPESYKKVKNTITNKNFKKFEELETFLDSLLSV